MKKKLIFSSLTLAALAVGLTFALNANASKPQAQENEESKDLLCRKIPCTGGVRGYFCDYSADPALPWCDDEPLCALWACEP